MKKIILLFSTFSNQLIIHFFKSICRPANYPDFSGIIPIFMLQPESRYRVPKTSKKPDFHKFYPRKFCSYRFPVMEYNIEILSNQIHRSIWYSGHVDLPEDYRSVLTLKYYVNIYTCLDKFNDLSRFMALNW